jgi:transcriptional regulator GlxA family with amidase domain
MDLALAMVADDHDDEIARQVAQWLVIYLRRTGGQSQFSAPVAATTARRDEIRRAQDWIAADPSRDCSVEALADAAAMSPRHFARIFGEQVGTTPARYVESCRIDMARTLLETTDLTLAQVAGRCGIGDPSTLHRVFERRLGTTPAAYRSHFRRNS